MTTGISIIGFEDPLYVVNSHGRVTNAIIQSNITNFVVGNDVSNLLIHANHSYYAAHNDSPSFLMRLTGDLGNSTYGIESLVNVDKFLQQGLSINDKSIVDFIYFGTKNPESFRINNTQAWFKLNGAHSLPTFQIDNNGHIQLYQTQNVVCKPSDTVCITK